MTNEMIIFNERIRLMKEGILQGTGNKIIVEDAEGNKLELEEPEEIHTFLGWKKLGFSVMKGQKAISKLVIWNHVTKKAKTEDEEDDEKMFQKLAFFFKASQVEPLNEQKGA